MLLPTNEECNRVETEREIPKLKFITHGVLTDYDMLLYLARISIW